ncbi:MAG: response regulator transcription factor [Ignavibacteriales bacterium]|nr:response regulator transcription factor [Ignavibacteriales bacterium]
MSEAKQLTILIIDDDPLLRTLTSRFLKDLKTVQIVGIAETGNIGIDMIKAKKPHIVILDIQLPDTNAQTIIEQAKLLTPPARVYLCSAYSDDRVEATVKQVYADGFVSKTNLKNGLTEMVLAELARLPA